MNLGLADRAICIAGGSRGMGRAAADLLAAEGCRVAVLGRHDADVRPAEDDLIAAGASDAVGLQCDLLDTGEVEASFTFLDERWGELNGVINAAGPSRVGALDDLTENEWLEDFDVGVVSMIRTVRAALPLLRKATFARIVNLAEASIRHQSPGLIAHTAANAAMASASKNLARALAPEGILVNTVCPGTVMSPALEQYLTETDSRGLPEGPLEAGYAAIVRDFGAENDLGRVGPGRAQYTHLLDDEASVVDDLIVWWLGPEELLVIPNAANTAPALAAVHSATGAPGGADVERVTGHRALLAVQGP